MSLASDIREFAFKNIVVPQLSTSSVASFTAGEIHTKMGLKDRVPAVCAALDTKLFEDEYDLKLIERLGRPVSTRTRFVFSALEVKRYGAEKIQSDHRARLGWFEDNAGENVFWSSLSAADFRLASLPKGIYRPAGWKYALSVKVMLSGKYDDSEAELGDGVMQLRYSQEEPRDADPLKYFTNIGLRNCLIDKVPVGIIRQVTVQPKPSYEIIGLGRVVDWSGGFFTLNISRPDDTVAPQAGTPEPVSLEDARKRTLRAIVTRRGQAAFRVALLKAYNGRCAFSGCDTSEVLEAAHIKPYLGEHTNVVPNGLLLRSDLHTLFDLRLIRVDPEHMTLHVHSALRNSSYGGLHGCLLNKPVKEFDWPSTDSLLFAWEDQNYVE